MSKEIGGIGGKGLSHFEESPIRNLLCISSKVAPTAKRENSLLLRLRDSDLKFF